MIFESEDGTSICEFKTITELQNEMGTDDLLIENFGLEGFTTDMNSKEFESGTHGILIKGEIFNPNKKEVVSKYDFNNKGD